MTTTLKLAITELHRSETSLARQLTTIAARHHADQDIHHLALDLAVWSDDHARLLVEHGAGRFGIRVPRDVSERLQQRVSEALRHRPEPALLLLAGLRRVHRAAAGVSLDWELLAQGAQASKNQDLLVLTKRCHPQTLRQMRWANAMLKELSPQALSA